MGLCVAIRIGAPILRADVQGAVAPALFLPEDRHDERWLEVFDVLLDYVAYNGHSCPKRQEAFGDESLGEWVHFQRQQYARGRLRPARVAVLGLVPGWAWDALDETWMRHLALLNEAAGTGAMRLHRVDAFQDTALGRWAELQRQLYRNGTLSGARAALLEAVPGWNWLTRQDVAWQQNYEAFKAAGTGPTSDHLRQWANRQRLDYAVGTLPPERRAALERLTDWSWRLFATQWEQQYQRLDAFARHHGHCDPATGDRVDGVELRQWVHRQRALRRAGRLPSDRAAAMEALPGWSWDSPTRRRAKAALA